MRPGDFKSQKIDIYQPVDELNKPQKYMFYMQNEFYTVYFPDPKNEFLIYLIQSYMYITYQHLPRGAN